MEPNFRVQSKWRPHQLRPNVPKPCGINGAKHQCSQSKENTTTYSGGSQRRKIYYVLNVLQLKSNHKSLNAIYFWGQKVNIWAAAGDHRGVASH